ncbi:MAG: alpha/beta hydrolase [Acidobacteriaceae bacterium]
MSYAVLGAVMVVFWVAAWPLARAHLQAIAVMREVAGESAPRYARALTVPIETRDSDFQIETPAGPQQVRARLYLPQGEPDAPALVIFHGVHHLGIEEPRLVGFARAMASCGIRVLTPELPDIKDYHVSRDSVRTIGESVRWFARQTAGPVGVMGLSFAGGLALVAAEDPAYGPNFKFVVAVGSQDSMARVTKYYQTGRAVRPDGTIEVLPAHEYGPLVIEYEYLEGFLPAADLEPVRAVLRAHLYEDPKGEAAAMRLLNDTQKQEVAELENASLPATRDKIAAAIAGHAYEFPELSPERGLGTLTTPVYLLHGEADNVIPAAETLWMASELPRNDLKAMLVSPVLSHVSVEMEPGMMEEWRLVRFFGMVMRAAETPGGR